MDRKGKIVFQCTYFKNGKPCKFAGRKDNLKRHVTEVHLKQLRTCEVCGEKMTKSGLNRHLQYQHGISVETSPLPSDQCCELNNIPSENIDGNQSPTSIVEQIEYTIEAKIKLLTLKDGTKTIVPFKANVIIDNLIVDITASCSGKLQTERSSEHAVEADLSGINQQVDVESAVLKNDVLLTPVDSPVENGKLIRFTFKFYPKTERFE